MIIFEVNKEVRLSGNSPIIPVPVKIEFLNIPALTGSLSAIYLN